MILLKIFIDYTLFQAPWNRTMWANVRAHLIGKGRYVLPAAIKITQCFNFSSLLMQFSIFFFFTMKLFCWKENRNTNPMQQSTKKGNWKWKKNRPNRANIIVSVIGVASFFGIAQQMLNKCFIQFETFWIRHLCIRFCCAKTQSSLKSVNCVKRKSRLQNAFPWIESLPRNYMYPFNYAMIIKRIFLFVIFSFFGQTSPSITLDTWKSSLSITFYDFV